MFSPLPKKPNGDFCVLRKGVCIRKGTAAGTVEKFTNSLMHKRENFFAWENLRGERLYRPLFFCQAARRGCRKILYTTACFIVKALATEESVAERITTAGFQQRCNDTEAEMEYSFRYQ